MNSLFNINVCRVCMHLDQTNDLWSDKSLLAKFEFTTGLQVAKEDNLPKNICSKCTSRLKVAYIFIKMAHESENNLKNFVKKISSEFKEVTRGNKSNKKFPNEQNFSEDDLLSLIDEETHENILTDTSVKDKSGKTCEEEVKNLSNNVVNNPKEDLDNCKYDTSYSFSKDILLIPSINDVNSEYENTSHFMEIPVEDKEGKTQYNKEGDNELKNNETCNSINMLESNEDSELCQSADFPVDELEENHKCDVIIDNQDDGSLQYQSICIDESSIDGINEKGDECNISNLNEKCDDFNDKEVHKNLHDENEINEHLETEAKIVYKKQNIGHRFYCDKCNRDFSTKTNLNRHMQSHEGNKAFSCSECKKSFTQKSTLKQHMYTHTGERPYICEVCNRGFTQCKSLIFHMRRHTGEKPFYCEYCLITFRQKDALRIHILKHHVVIERAVDGTEIFLCIICQKKFETKLEFKTHMKVHTAAGEVDNVIEFVRDEEEKLYTKITNSIDVVPSLEVESFNAAIVNVSASSAAEPSRAKKFQCRKCFKCFALKKSLLRHMRIHYIKNDDNLPECLDCDLQFSSAEVYQKHLSICLQSC